jgi:hypothetical protein
MLFFRMQRGMERVMGMGGIIEANRKEKSNEVKLGCERK